MLVLNFSKIMHFCIRTCQAKGVYVSHLFHEDRMTSILIGFNFYKKKEKEKVLDVGATQNLETAYFEIN